MVSSDVAQDIQSDSSPSNPVARGDTVLHEGNEYDPPPLYSPSSSASYPGTTGTMACPSSQDSVRLSGSVRRRREASAEHTAEDSGGSDDSGPHSDIVTLEDPESETEYTEGNYPYIKDHRRPVQAQDFRRTSLPRENRASPSSYALHGQRSTSHLAFGPGRAFNATSGPGGTSDTIFGQGGTFDTLFGTGGTYRPGVHDGNGRRPTQGSSYANVNTLYDSGNVTHHTWDYNNTSQEPHGSLRDEGFDGDPRFTRSEFQDRLSAQNNHWQQRANYNIPFTQMNQSVSWFENSSNVTITGPTSFQHYEIVHNHTPGNHVTTTITQFRVN